MARDDLAILGNKNFLLLAVHDDIGEVDRFPIGGDLPDLLDVSSLARLISVAFTAAGTCSIVILRSPCPSSSDSQWSNQQTRRLLRMYW